MSQSDHIDEPLSSHDELLIDLAYGELGAVEAETARGVLAEADLTGKLEALVAMRGMFDEFAELADEDPPAAITSKLLHIAATQGPAAARSPGEGKGIWAWLSEWMRPLMMHPGLVVAASMVVVAGVAGSMYMAGTFSAHDSVMHNMQPEQKREQVARAMSLPAADEMPASKPVAEGAVAGKADIQATGIPAESAADREADKIADSDSAESPASVTSGYGYGRTADLAELDDRALVGGKSKVTKQRRSAPSKSTRSESTAAAPPSFPEPQKAMPRPARAPSGDDDSKAGSIDVGVADKPDSKKLDKAGNMPPAAQQQEPQRERRSEVESLHDEARAAAASGDCATVRTMSAKIRQLDAAYYRKVIRKDTALSHCLSENKK